MVQVEVGVDNNQNGGDTGRQRCSAMRADRLGSIVHNSTQVQSCITVHSRRSPPDHVKRSACISKSVPLVASRGTALPISQVVRVAQPLATFFTFPTPPRLSRTAKLLYVIRSCPTHFTSINTLYPRPTSSSPSSPAHLRSVRYK